MAYLDVAAWSADHVVSWLRGLHQSLEETSLEQVIRSRTNGKRLMLLAAQDIVELIKPIKIEALQAILSGIKLLNYISYTSNQETLQSLTLNLACQARYLNKQLIQAELSPRLLPVSTATNTPLTGTGKDRFDFAKVDSNFQINQSTKQRVSLETLDSVSIIVDQILSIVNWFNSTGLAFKKPEFNKDFKSIVLRVAVELTSTAQRDLFVEQPNEFIKKTSKFLADYCEWVVLAIDDADYIQPCWLDIVSIKKKPDEIDFGFVLQSATIGILTIEDVIFSSPAHRSGRITAGDEIIQVDYQTVLGWPSSRIEQLIKTYTSEVILTIKKRPSQFTLNPSVIVRKPYAIPLKKILSRNSESLNKEVENSEIEVDKTEESNLVENIQINADDEVVLEPPKEPKGPVYELQASKPRRELKRRVSISGSISDALVDLSLADALPIPSLEKAAASKKAPIKSKLNRITKETLTKSVSHDTAKLYLHTLSIDRKYLWLPQVAKDD